MCFGCSKEPSHLDGSFEHPQHMFWLRNMKNNFQLHNLRADKDFKELLSSNRYKLAGRPIED